MVGAAVLHDFLLMEELLNLFLGKPFSLKLILCGLTKQYQRTFLSASLLPVAES